MFAISVNVYSVERSLPAAFYRLYYILCQGCKS